MDNCLNDDLITISDLTFSHGDRLLYDRINLTIPRGKVTAVMGPSGISKTTLLKFLDRDTPIEPAAPAPATTAVAAP